MRELTEQERAMRYEPFLDDDLRATLASLLEREAKPTDTAAAHARLLLSSIGRSHLRA